MIELRPPFRAAKKVLGDGTYIPGKIYRKSYFAVDAKTEDGQYTLLYHSLLKCFIRVENRDFEALSEGKADPSTETGAYLYKNYFLVPEDTDEMKSALSVRELLNLFRKKSAGIHNYVVLPTTDCNARCFYCYEAGCEKLQMTEETADRLVSHMIRVRGDHEPVKIQWFGGEPTLKASIISRVCKGLRDAAVPFHSEMISNAFLYDEALVKTAVEEWNLTNIQITLDGTEEIYNKRKAFIDKSENAFKRVLRNIGLLGDAGVSVSVRLNMDGKNAEDLNHLSDELYERFKGRKNIRVYAHLLYQVSDADDAAYDAYFALQRKLTIRSMNSGRSLRDKLKINRCMADSDDTVVVLPDGRMTSCEHFNEVLPPWGTIGSDEKDEETLKKWREYHGYTDECKTCAYMPDCMRLKQCPEEDGTCGKHRKILHLMDMRNGMEATYKKWEKEEEK